MAIEIIACRVLKKERPKSPMETQLLGTQAKNRESSQSCQKHVNIGTKQHPRQTVNRNQF